jgi:hypothetical protein
MHKQSQTLNGAHNYTRIQIRRLVTVGWPVASRADSKSHQRLPVFSAATARALSWLSTLNIISLWKERAFEINVQCIAKGPIVKFCAGAE